MSASTTYQVRAVNHAANHSNRIHDPAYARSVGFAGGLVPGVDIYAYMTRPVVQAWGVEWLERGAMEVRFLKPVVDAEDIVVKTTSHSEGLLQIEVRGPNGELRAAANAELRPDAEAPAAAYFPVRALPDDPPLATPDALEAMPLLGSLRVELDAVDVGRQLVEVGETLGLYREQALVHPGRLLRLADSILSANLKLPPWLHVGSSPQHFRAARVGDLLTVRARRLDLFERKGHRFVRLDIAAFDAENLPVFRVNPYTAIYRPAFNAQS